jgi:hypothetical protein
LDFTASVPYVGTAFEWTIMHLFIPPRSRPRADMGWRSPRLVRDRRRSQGCERLRVRPGRALTGFGRAGACKENT